MIIAKLKYHYFLVLILIFSAVLLSVNLGKPFVGHHDWNGVWYSNFARNLVKYGLWQTKFGSVMTYDLQSPDNFKYFTHYPPLLPILIFFSFKIFGIHEWSARLIPLMFSLGTIILIYWLGVKFFNKRIAVLASAISAVLPVVIYFGKMPVHEIVNLPFVLLSILLYFNFAQKSTTGNFLKLSGSLFLSHLVHWSGYFVTPLFFIHYLIFGNEKRKFLIALFFPLLSLGILGLHLAHTFWLTGSPVGGGLIDIFLERTNVTNRPIGYSTINFLKLQARLITVYFTRPVLLFAAITLIWILVQIKNRHLTKKVQLMVICGLFGITYNVLFRNAAFIHDYTIFYLWPFLALAASFGFSITVDSFKFLSKRITILTILVVITIGFERLSFTKALLSSSGFSPGFTLGKIINQKTESGQRVLILSPDFKRYFEAFTEYYADRLIDYGLPKGEQLEEYIENDNYRLIIAIPSRDTPQPLIDVLQQQYKMTKIDQFIIFDRNEPKQVSFRNYSGL